MKSDEVGVTMGPSRDGIGVGVGIIILSRAVGCEGTVWNKHHRVKSKSEETHTNKLLH